MADWITFQELLKRWDIVMLEFVECLKKGLQPYSKYNRRPLNCPPSWHLGHIFEKGAWASSQLEELGKSTLFAQDQKESVEKELKIIKKDDPDLVSWKWLTELSDEDCKQLYSYLDEPIFKRNDVSEFEGKHDLGASKEPDRLFDRQENYFHLNGDYWEIGYKGKETKLRNLERLRYIVHLLDNAGKEIYSHDLVKLVKGDSPEANKDYAEMDEERLETEEGLSIADIYIPNISEEEKDDLEDRVCEIWERLKKSTGGPAEKNTRKDWDTLKRYFRNEHGIEIYESKKELKFYKRSRLNKDAEKARVNVAQNISKALKDIESALPALGRHLRKQIDKGAKCIYRVDADDPIAWDISM